MTLHLWPRDSPAGEAGVIGIDLTTIRKAAAREGRGKRSGSGQR
jgi:hypothetical protein